MISVIKYMTIYTHNFTITFNVTCSSPLVKCLRYSKIFTLGYLKQYCIFETVIQIQITCVQHRNSLILH